MDTQNDGAVKKKPKKQKTYSVTVKANKKGRHYMKWLNVFRVLVLPVFWLLKPFKYYGDKKAPDGACVMVCNHYKMLDIAYVAATTWEGVHFVGKRSVTEAPFMKTITKFVKVIPVNRDGNDVRAILDCFKCLKNGEKISIFPEGTRNKAGADMLPFKHGASLMAIKTKSPILPMVIYKEPKWFRMTHIIMGEPFEFTEYYDKKMSDEEYAEADEKLRQKMLELRAEHTRYLESKKNKKKRNG